MERSTIHIKTMPELRARAEACARLEGLSLPEFVRMAIRDRCAVTEKTDGQRERAARRAGRERDD